MGIENERPYSKPEDMERISRPPPPPGFISQTAFVLKKVPQDIASSTPVPGQDHIADLDLNNEAAFKRHLNKRPWIVHAHTTPSSEAVKPMVSARRLPKVSETRVLEEAPVFHPTEEEFSDTLSYIASLRDKAKPYGICCVVPPPSWKPPCLLEEQKIWETTTFTTQLQLFDGDCTEKPKEADVKSDDSASNKVKFCRIECGPSYHLQRFKAYAESSRKMHFSVRNEVLGSKNSSSSQKPEEPTLAEIEKEYRQLIESPLVEIGVLYGNDLDTRTYGSGFPLPEDSEPSEYDKYKASGWNLNNTAKLPGSLLSFEDCESICVPSLSLGTCLSSQFWKSEKERLYVLGYLHVGAPRVWYSVAENYGSKFRDIEESLISEASKEQPNTSQNHVLTMSPYALNVEGIPVTRCVQNPGQYVVIFPGSHYSAFDCGFNCLEKVNFAPLDWLPYGYAAVQLNEAKSKMSVISYDKLLLRAAREAVKCLTSKNTTANIMIWKNSCGEDGIFSNSVKSRIKEEKNKREYLNCLESKRMEKSYDIVSKRECCVCYADLHISAVQCSCSPDRFSCLRHMRNLCDCSFDSKSFLYRYTMDEMNFLVEALVSNSYSAMEAWERIERDNCVSSTITSSQSAEKDNETDEVISTFGNITMRDVAAGIEQQQLKSRVKTRSMADIMSEKEGSVQPCSNKSTRPSGSSASNLAKKRKAG